MSFEFLILNFEFHHTHASHRGVGSVIQNSKFKIQNLSLTERELPVPPAFHEGSGW
jgi:hypothetical protein